MRDFVDTQRKISLIFVLYCQTGGERKKPQSEPCCVPRQHETTPNDRCVSLEHTTVCSLGPGEKNLCVCVCGVKSWSDQISPQE